MIHQMKTEQLTGNPPYSILPYSTGPVGPVGSSMFQPLVVAGRDGREFGDLITT